MSLDDFMKVYKESEARDKELKLAELQKWNNLCTKTFVPKREVIHGKYNSNLYTFCTGWWKK